MNSSKKLIILTVIILLSIAILGHAEDEEKWRNFEVAMDAGLTLPMGELSDWNDSLGAKVGYNIGTFGGYYVTNSMCVGIYFDYSRMKMEEPPSEGTWDRKFQMYNFGAYVKYAIVGESNFEPYVKLTCGAVWTKFPTWVTEDLNRLREQSYDPALSLGGYLGLMYYTSDYGAIFLEAGYRNDFTDGTEADYRGFISTINENLNYVEIRGGVTAFFGSE
nr:hypothetical protein [candidate division Zixibacteria bacterium]